MPATIAPRGANLRESLRGARKLALTKLMRATAATSPWFGYPRLIVTVDLRQQGNQMLVEIFLVVGERIQGRVGRLMQINLGFSVSHAKV